MAGRFGRLSLDSEQYHLKLQFMFGTPVVNVSSEGLARFRTKSAELR
jgi:hypothetical protein